MTTTYQWGLLGPLQRNHCREVGSPSVRPLDLVFPSLQLICRRNVKSFTPLGCSLGGNKWNLSRRGTRDNPETIETVEKMARSNLFPCPNCHGGSLIKSTVEKAAMIIRYRKCRDCGSNFSTRESVIGSPPVSLSIKTLSENVGSFSDV